MLGVVLAGGKGMRLRPLTEMRPKPFVPILGRPCIDYALDLYDSIGITDVMMTTFYMPEMLISHLGGGLSRNMRLVYSIEDEAMGTAGGIAKVRNFINDPFVVVSGDLFVDADLSDLVSFHKKSGAAVTMALTEVANPVEYGIVGLDDDGRIDRFKEKPSEEEVFSNLINAGIYVIEPEVLDKVPEGRKFDFSRDLFPILREEGTLFGRKLDGIWMDIGRPEDLLRANREEASKKLREADGDVEKSGLIHPDARIDGTVKGVSYIAKGVTVEREATVEDSFILAGSRIGRASSVTNSLLLDGTLLAKRCTVRDTILGAGTKVENDSKLEECVLGDGTQVPGGSWLVRQKKV